MQNESAAGIHFLSIHNIYPAKTQSDTYNFKVNTVPFHDDKVPKEGVHSYIYQ